jgi:hypothetical protein
LATGTDVSTGTITNNYDSPEENYTFGVKGIVGSKSLSQTQLPINTSATIEDIRQAIQTRNLRF